MLCLTYYFFTETYLVGSHCNHYYILLLAPSQYDCNFEQKTTCSWTQDQTDVFDWTVQRGRTSSVSTGPSFDHTTQSANGESLVQIITDGILKSFLSYFIELIKLS